MNIRWSLHKSCGFQPMLKASELVKTYTVICGLPGPNATSRHTAQNFDANNGREAARAACERYGWQTVKVRPAGPVEAGKLAQFILYSQRGQRL
jgi:hypothetical protein